MEDNMNVTPEQPEEGGGMNQTPEQPGETGRKGKKKVKKSWKQELREWIVALGTAIIIVTIIQSFLFRIIRVDGESMETTLHDGERLFVNVAEVKFSNTVPRNSIVICNYPNRYTNVLGIKFKTYFVKRLVGVPGDTIYRENGVTHVVYTDADGNSVDEPLDERFALYYINGSPDDYGPYTLGEDEYFVVGDNRYNSHDSRDWKDSDDFNDVGPISKSMIVGCVREVIWPLNHIRAAK
ncbi:MAG: signal peptidase I [Clostridia bacterium]|nr:signal peptidase I [Clostridia bacterium]